MAYEIPLTKDEFITELKENWNTFKADKLNTALVISEFIVKEKLSMKSVNSLKTMSKDNLKKEVLEGLEIPLKNQAKKPIVTVNASFAHDVVEVLNNFKLELQGTALNPFLAKQAIKAIDSLINKLEDKNKLENLGMIGNGVILLFTVIDTFIDIKTIPQKIKDFKAKREAKANADTNKQ